LPDEGEGEGLVGVHDILTLDTDEREVELLSELNAVVAVFELLVSVWWVPVDALVIDDSRLDLVEELEEDGSVSEIFVEVVDEWIDTKRVHPVTEGLLFTSLFDLDLEFDGLKSGPGVEKVGNERKVELWVTLANVLGSDELSAVELLGSLENALGSGVQVANLQAITVAVLGSDLGKENGVVLRVLDVTAEVVDTSVPSSVFLFEEQCVSVCLVLIFKRKRKFPNVPSGS